MFPVAASHRHRKQRQGPRWRGQLGVRVRWGGVSGLVAAAIWGRDRQVLANLVGALPLLQRLGSDGEGASAHGEEHDERPQQQGHHGPQDAVQQDAGVMGTPPQHVIGPGTQSERTGKLYWQKWTLTLKNQQELVIIWLLQPWLWSSAGETVNNLVLQIEVRGQRQQIVKRTTLCHLRRSPPCQFSQPHTSSCFQSVHSTPSHRGGGQLTSSAGWRSRWRTGCRPPWWSNPPTTGRCLCSSGCPAHRGGRTSTETETHVTDGDSRSFCLLVLERLTTSHHLEEALWSAHLHWG